MVLIARALALFLALITLMFVLMYKQHTVNPPNPQPSPTITR